MSSDVGADGWDFFVSYTQSDRGWAEWVAWVLEEDEFRVLLQAWDFGVGSNWVRGMDDGVSRARRTVALLSEGYAKSANCAAEWQAAWRRDQDARDRALLVLRTEDCPRPGLLAQVVSGDLFGLAEADARAVVLDAARSAAGLTGRAKPSQRPAFPGWQGASRRAAFPGVAGLRPPRSRPSRAVLPVLPARFVARDDDVDALRALLVDAHTGPVVGVVAMGGAGKSTLARALVQDNAVREAFPDGIVWVEVNPRPDLAALQTQVLTAFGSPEPVSDVRVGTERLRDLLAGGVCLIVLDNVWDREVLPAFPVPPGSRLLATTRDRDTLFADSVAYRLGQVDDAMARRLLARYAGCDVAELPGEATEIIRRCGGLVLALVLLGGMVGEGRRWATAAARLSRADLAWFDGRFSDYTQGLLAALEASVAALGAREADRFRELAVFEGHGPVPVEVSALLWQATGGLDALDAEDLLSMLGRRSLVQIDPVSDTFMLHDLLIDYARETLPPGRHEQLHGLLAHCLLSRWGGLDAALPGLQGHATRDAVDRYGLSELVSHLLAARMPVTVDEVLTAERVTPGADAESVWYVAHENQGTTGAYLADVRAASREARARESTDDTSGLARQIGYSLILGSITSLAANIPPNLLVRLVNTGLWPPSRALAYAQSAPNADSRARALTGLLPYLPVDQRDVVSAQALTTARAIPAPDTRAASLAELAPYLPADQRGPVLAQAYASTKAIPWPDVRAKVLRALAPHLPTELLEEALKTVLIVEDPWEATAFEDPWGGVLIPDGFGEVLSGLVSHLPAALLMQALAVATRSNHPDYRAEVSSRLVSHLPGEERAAVVARTLVDVSTMDDPDRRAEVLSRLVPQMPIDQREPVAAQALVAVLAIHEEYTRVRVLSELTPWLSADLLARALTAATTLDSPDMRAWALAIIAPHLPASQRRPVLIQALAVPATEHWPVSRNRALTQAAPHLPADLLPRAFAVAVALGDSGARAEALVGLAPYLPVRLLAEALATATTIDPPYGPAGVLERLAPYLSGDLLAQALAIAATMDKTYDRARALSGLAPGLDADLLIQALTAARGIDMPFKRAELLTRLLPHLPAGEREAVVARALTAALGVSKSSERAEALTRLLPHLPAGEREAVVARALTAALGVSKSSERAEALTRLLPHLPVEEREAVVARALTAAFTADSRHEQARLVAGLAGHLPMPALDWAIATAAAIENAEDQVEVLSGLASRLPADRLAEIVTAASAIVDDNRRARTLARIAPHLPSDHQGPVLTAVLTTPVSPDWPGDRPDVLASLAPYLPARMLGQALSAAGAMSSGYDGELTRALAGLAPYLPAELLRQAVTVANSLEVPFDRVQALLELVPHLPVDDRQPVLARALEAATGIDQPYYRAEALAELTRHLLPVQRGPVLAEALISASVDGRGTVIDVLLAALACSEEGDVLAAETVPWWLRVQRWWP
ncbi:toll/interleukin-1 receptor domain-containing protein [Frankia sp. R43]|uniref:toll/interleukin-1 receptor domain-containing protein n=1 Tax=Frankia sp. R43 TaxID=269536 RepID=UPI000A6FE0A0|nr:toll/interleukin-1 receptor domain-containing protein [Frankia sp. R43]